MKINRYKPPKSSFLSVDKDIATISELFIDNDRLCRLLFRTDKSPMQAANLTEQEKIQLFADEYIRTAPKLDVDQDVMNYVLITFDNFVPTGNPEFRDNTIAISILCHYSQWHIADNCLRPYRIAGEIDSMLDGARLSGIGTLEFSGGKLIGVNKEYGGICLAYKATHGEDDKKHFENPDDEVQFLEEVLGTNG